MKLESLLKLIKDEDGNNFGAITVIEKITNTYPSKSSDKILQFLLDSNITGSKLWSKYKYEHNENIVSMVESLNII